MRFAGWRVERPNRHQILLVLAVVCLTGCSTTAAIKGISYTEADLHSLPEKVTINVVRISQDDGKSCATTSVAMAISHYLHRDESPLSKDAVWDISGSDEATVESKGNDIAGLKRIADHYGFDSEFVQGMTFQQTEYLLSKGILMVLFFNLNPEGTKTHAVLATGYDQERGIIQVNDPSNYFKTLSFQFLESNWKSWLSSPRIESVRAAFIIYPKVLDASSP
jgi:hypothetical protein